MKDVVSNYFSNPLLRTLYETAFGHYSCNHNTTSNLATIITLHNAAAPFGEMLSDDV